MRHDDPIPPFATVNPDYDLDVSALWIRYCIGDEQNPDEVIDVSAHSDFRIDSTVREEVRALPLDLDVREMRIQPQGVDAAYLIDVWVQGTAVGVLSNLVTGKIQELKHTFGPVSRTDSNATEFDARQAREHTPLAELQLLNLAQSIIPQHYPDAGKLAPLATDTRELRSPSTFSGTVVLRGEDGSTFIVIMESDGERWRVTRTIRSYPES